MVGAVVVRRARTASGELPLVSAHLLDTNDRRIVSPCDCSMLHELVDYMNGQMDRLGSRVGEPWFSAQSSQLAVRGERVEAAVGPFTLRSETHRITSVTALAQPVGYYSTLRASTQSGRPLSADSLLRLQPSDAAAVAMDRLFRVLHMLNHLGCAREHLDLWVHTSLRHVLAVEARHGAFFEDVLKRCGLGAERIVMIVPALPVADRDFARLTQAYREYSVCGFRLALDLPSLDMDVLAAVHRIDPAFVRVRERDLPALRTAGLRTPALVRDLGRHVGGETPFDASDYIELYDSQKLVFLP